MPRRKNLLVIAVAVNLQKTTAYRLVAVNAQGRRIGEDNGRSKLTEHEVELMRALHEEFEVGDARHFGYRRLAAKFGCTKTLARKICNYLLRNQHPARFKRGTQ